MAQGAFRGQELVAVICTLAKLQYRPEPGAVLCRLLKGTGSCHVKSLGSGLGCSVHPILVSSQPMLI